MNKAWFLESIAADGSHVAQPIRELPFRIGRDPLLNHLVVDARGLSRQHAVLEADASGKLRLTDQGSTNGTFVDRQRIAQPVLVAEGAVIHFGNAEFRLGLEGSPDSVLPENDERTMIVRTGAHQLSSKFVQHERQFLELLQGQGIAAAAQPIVDAAGGSLFAYELLGRCRHPELPNSPGHLFHLAEQLDRGAELSEAFRRHGVPAIAPRLGGLRLFVNTHAKEIFADGFFAGVEALLACTGSPKLVVEVHESAIVDIGRMKALAARLAAIGVDFAYDDFGAGQARLVELAEAPADFVKFDMGLVKDLHRAPEGKQRMVRELVRLVLDLGSVPLAEGVELQEEADLCRDMGFRLLQGYLTGRPVPVESV